MWVSHLAGLVDVEDLCYYADVNSELIRELIHECGGRRSWNHGLGLSAT
jgi:hypothetical protein